MVRAMVLTGPDAFELRDLPPPELRPDNAIVRVELCGCCGTDIKYARGRLAAPWPMILGHEIVGRIERKGLRIVALELRLLDADTAKHHYAEHAGSTEQYPWRWNPEAAWRFMTPRKVASAAV